MNKAYINEWIDRAERDLRLISYVDDYNMCFHAQQCVEKMVKAAMLFEGKNIIQTHDLGLLINNLSSGWDIKTLISNMINLTKYAVSGRYPVSDKILQNDAKEAYDLAQRAYDSVMADLRSRGL